MRQVKQRGVTTSGDDVRHLHVEGVQSSALGRERSLFTWPRRCLAASRRRCDPRVGRVARRGGGGGARASRNRSARRSRAAVRLRRCDRCSAASMVIVVPTKRSRRRSSTRARWTSSSASLAAMSKVSCTRESVVLTPWPPGPELREKRSTSSADGTLNPSGMPAPGGTRRSATRSLSRVERMVSRVGRGVGAGRPGARRRR